MNLSPARTPASLKDAVRRAVLTAVAAVAIVATAFAIITVLDEQLALEMSGGSPSTGSVVQDANADVTRLIEQHDCWTSAANTPADMRGKMPGHTVVTTVASPSRPTYSAELVGPALDKTFAPDRRTYANVLTVHAFCR